MIISVLSFFIITASPPQDRQIVALTLPKSWELTDKKASPHLRQMFFAAKEGETQTHALMVNVINKESVSFEKSRKMTNDMLQAECYIEKLPLIIQQKNDKAKSVQSSRIEWVLYACEKRKRSGWFLTLDADDKTVTQLSLEVSAFPISGELREELLEFIKRYVVFCISYDDDCSKATMKSAVGLPNALVVLLPTFLDDPSGVKK
jgi:hypothetical protein